MAKKRKLLSRLGAFVKPALRGAIKSLPFGNTALEVAKNVAHEVKHDRLKDTKNYTGIERPETPHNWISILVQLLCVAAIVYAFLTKTITIEELVQLLNPLSNGSN